MFLRTLPFRTVRRVYTTSLNSTLTQLLSHIGSKAECEQYLHQYATREKQKFAVIKVGGAVVEEQLDELAQALTFLYQVGLYPIVVHGAGPQLNKQLAAAKIEASYHNGIRITDPRTLGIARKIFQEENLKIVDALEKLGTHARPLIGGVFVAEYLDKAKYNLVGSITNVNKRSLESSISAGALPILTSLAETPDGQILNVNADVAASELAAAFQPLKVVYLNTTCGMIDPTTKKKIDIINLDEEYQELLKQPWMKFGARLKLEQIHDMLMKLPSNHSVAITSAQHLSKELFTHSGSGTLIRRGHGITRHKSLKSIDERLLTSLLSLDPTFSSDPEAIGEFLNSLPEDSVIYTDASYQSCAVVQPANHEFPYPVLTKFVHTEAASLENTHTQLMMAIKKDFSQLIWAVERGAKESWWYEMSDGSISRNNLRLFWTGIDNLTQVPERYPGVVGSIPNGVLITPQSRNYSTKRVALIGARGHTGQELITLISNHPEMILTHVSSRELKGQTVDAYTKNPDLRYTSLTPEDVQKIETAKEVDAWVLALPNNLSTPFVEAITQDSTTHSVIVDLSADHRFRPDWTYGLPELNRSISWGRKIANPGCYATAAQLCIFPFLKYLDATVRPVVVAVSGYSGAGTKPSPNNDPGNVRDNLIWYSQTGHIHEREVSSRMKTDIWFTPAVGGWFRGIGMSVQLGISEEYAGRTIEQWREVLESTYQGESLIKISEAPPAVKGIANQHYAMVGGLKLDKSGRRLVVTGTIDNLLKGAATQAMQNLNLSLHLSEHTSIPE